MEPEMQNNTNSTNQERGWAHRTTSRVDIEKAVAKSLGMKPSVVADVTRAIFSEIAVALADQGRVEIRRFGTWSVKEMAPRTVRNPSTGEKFQISASKKVSFKPGKALKAMVAEIEETA